ncbi:rhamnogalacturonan acetylesterase [Algoriphagus persicinus]|uniref:rhamnogalacturonan acetylesterase n=1 Tax=Algoriphagus persicinus TaxID=3108754 RepID=UPI002B364A9E|nr:rhamnogalacturonan acetylesterase [Algoriphagus sp. E1-3-M2]MEB2786354.1 rhamnogalacturonan acetylesterase [Algoriphagus sp. E1-3-M2]
MKKLFQISITLIALSTLLSFVKKEKVSKIYLIGDSTMADYSKYEGEDYMKDRYPLTGWGQVFQPFMNKENLKSIKGLVDADSVVVDDRARGGRSTRSFFEEGRWSAVYRELKAGDLVIMQFGHNDAAKAKTERYVTVAGYKEYIRLFVNQSREKGATPIVLTPVARNYPWKDGHLLNVHGDYHTAAIEVAEELGALMIDLNQLSMDFFSEKGQEYVAETYFMNFEPGLYEAYPEGQKDNTHFQPAGAKAMAELVLEGMRDLAEK